MPQFTPFSRVNLETTCMQKVVNWTNGFSNYDETHLISDGASLTYCASYIECAHPGGKLWSSIFFSTNSTGTEGFSITWWGKDRSVKGQAQPKIVTEQEWYGVVKSKVVAGDYKVKNYIGRTVPLTANHSFVGEIVRDEKIPQLPVFAFSSGQAFAIGSAGGNPMKLGQVVAGNIKNCGPVEEFFKALRYKGFDINLLLNKAMSEAETTMASDFIAGLLAEGVSGAGDGVGPSGMPKAPEPVVNRAEVYGGGWGGFA